MTHVTYRRRMDQTRIVYVLPTLDIDEAHTMAAALAPEDFEHVATCQPGNGRMTVPPDAEHWDRYGAKTPDAIARRWSAEFATAMGRAA